MTTDDLAPLQQESETRREKQVSKLIDDVREREATIADLTKKSEVWAKDRAYYEKALASANEKAKEQSELITSLDKYCTQYKDAQEGGPAKLVAMIHNKLDYARDYTLSNIRENTPPHELVDFREWSREFCTSLTSILAPQGVAVFRQELDAICDETRNLEHADTTRFRAALKRIPRLTEEMRWDWYVPPITPPPSLGESW